MRALLVDPDPTLARNAQAAIEPANFIVQNVETGEEALELVKLYDFDVMLLDLALADVDGVQLIRRMRAIDINLPVMVLSRGIDQRTKIEALDAGADDLLTRPFDPDELIARLQVIVRRAKGHAGSVIRVGRMTIDLGARTVEIDGKPLSVTRKEYGILELLALRKGMTLTKETFLDHLYGGMDEPEHKIIDVFICKLRKKIAALAGDEAGIRTVWGRGYVLEEPAAAASGLAEDAMPFDHRTDRPAATSAAVSELDLLLDLLRLG